MSQIIYFRGLNSYGDHRLHLGPLALGSMDKYWKQGLESGGHEVFSILNFEFGDLESQIDRAKEEVISKLSPLREGPVHLMGHSAGGILARALAHSEELEGRVRSVITMASPHYGSPLAERLQGFPLEFPQRQRFIQRVGYDIAQRMEGLLCFSPEKMNEFNEAYPNRPDVKYACLPCGLPPHQWSFPLRVLHQLFSLAGTSDGLVSWESQVWGMELGRFGLDHLDQTGYHIRLWPGPYRREYQRLMGQVLEFYNKH